MQCYGIMKPIKAKQNQEEEEEDYEKRVKDL